MPLSFTENDMYPPGILAKRLNNRASFLINTGVYEEGISLLTRALKLSERSLSSLDNRNKTPCSCKFCSLGACLLTDQCSFVRMMNEEKDGHNLNKKNTNKYTTNENEDINDDNDGNEMMEYDLAHHHNNQVENNHQHRYQHYSFSSSSSQQEFCSTREPIDGFVYSRPLLVNYHSIEEDHFMGITLSLIILFNLSLAHHLLSIEELKKNKRKSRTKAKQALQLYEHAYELHNQHYAQQQPRPTAPNTNNNEIDEYSVAVVSLEFTMIVSNNIGEIHRVVGNSVVYKKCLRHLLSLVMYLVDNNFVLLNSNVMDGFYRNISPIMLKDVCAQAA